MKHNNIRRSHVRFRQIWVELFSFSQIKVEYGRTILPAQRLKKEHRTNIFFFFWQLGKFWTGLGMRVKRVYHESFWLTFILDQSTASHIKRNGSARAFHRSCEF